MLENFLMRVQRKEVGKCKHQKDTEMWRNKTLFGPEKQSERTYRCPPGFAVSTVVPAKLRC